MSSTPAATASESSSQLTISPSENCVMSIRPPVNSLTTSQYCSKKWFSAAPQECCILIVYTSAGALSSAISSSRSATSSSRLATFAFSAASFASSSASAPSSGAGPAQLATSGTTNIRAKQTLPININNLLAFTLVIPPSKILVTRV